MKRYLSLSIASVVSVLLCAALRAEMPMRSGSLLLMGGYERFENSLVWDEFRRLSGGPGKKVVLLAAAGQSDPQHYTASWHRTFSDSDWYLTGGPGP